MTLHARLNALMGSNMISNLVYGLSERAKFFGRRKGNVAKQLLISGVKVASGSLVKGGGAEYAARGAIHCDWINKTQIRPFTVSVLPTVGPSLCIRPL